MHNLCTAASAYATPDTTTEQMTNNLCSLRDPSAVDTCSKAAFYKELHSD